MMRGLYDLLLPKQSKYMYLAGDTHVHVHV